jgi:hypothetical protein
MRAKNSRREVEDGPALDRLDSGFSVRALSRPRHALAHCEVDLHAGCIELQGNQIRANTDPMVYITDYLSGGRYTSWWIKRQ